MLVLTSITFLVTLAVLRGASEARYKGIRLLAAWPVWSWNQIEGSEYHDGVGRA